MGEGLEWWEGSASWFRLEIGFWGRCGVHDLQNNWWAGCRRWGGKVCKEPYTIVVGVVRVRRWGESKVNDGVFRMLLSLWCGCKRSKLVFVSVATVEISIVDACFHLLCQFYHAPRCIETLIFTEFGTILRMQCSRQSLIALEFLRAFAFVSSLTFQK